jgi:cellobiose phosphorylase
VVHSSAAWFRVGLGGYWHCPAIGGLLLDPCVPKSWKKFSARRTFRGATYNIQFENPDGVECGVVAVDVDGTPQCESAGAREKMIKAYPAGSVHEVRVIMGKKP